MSRAFPCSSTLCVSFGSGRCCAVPSTSETITRCWEELDSILGLILREKHRYGQNRWPGLMRFLDDGRLEIDNNLTEQKIKPVVIARKNFLFADSVAGAKALCMHFSFIQTAKLHKHDPYHYYCILFKRLPHCKTLEDYERLLPWNINPDGSSKNDSS